MYLFEFVFSFFLDIYPEVPISGSNGSSIVSFFFFFFFKDFFLMWTIFKFIYLFIYGCVGSSFLCEGFL